MFSLIWTLTIMRRRAEIVKCFAEFYGRPVPSTLSVAHILISSFFPSNTIYAIAVSFTSVQKMWIIVFWQILNFSFCVYRQDIEIFFRYKGTLWQFEIYFLSSTHVALLCMGVLNANIISVFQWISNSINVWIIHKTAVVCNDVRCLIVFVVFRARFEIMHSITWPIEWAVASFELCQLMVCLYIYGLK
jgi:hypothetical protein